MSDSETQPPENTPEATYQAMLEYMERKADEWNLPDLHAQGAAAVRIATLLMLVDKWQGKTLHTTHPSCAGRNEARKRDSVPAGSTEFSR